MPTAIQVKPEVVKKEAIKALAEFQIQSRGMIVETPEQYLDADTFRARIHAKILWWKDRMESIRKPMREAKKAADDLFNEVNDPYMELEAQIVKSMSDFKRKELEDTRREQQEADRKARELIRKKEEQDRIAELARTPQMAARAMEKSSDIREQVEQILQSVSAPLQAEASTVRVRKLIKVVHMRNFLKAVVAGDIPMDCIEIVQSQLTKYYRDEPQTVRTWSGTEEYEDIGIASRRGI